MAEYEARSIREPPQAADSRQGPAIFWRANRPALFEPNCLYESFAVPLTVSRVKNSAACPGGAVVGLCDVKMASTLARSADAVGMSIDDVRFYRDRDLRLLFRTCREASLHLPRSCVRLHPFPTLRSSTTLAHCSRVAMCTLSPTVALSPPR
jgi:hypothetical protein